LISSVEKEYRGLVDAYEEAGGEWGMLLDKEVAKLSGLLSN